MARLARSSGRVQGGAPAAPRPYLYQAATPTGGRSWGFKSARDPRHLNEQLRAERLVHLRSWALPSLGGASGGSREASLKDQAEVHVQLAQLLNRGVPLVEALEVTAEAVTKAMKPRIVRMKDLVASGSNFADACTAVGGFDSVTIAVYRAAERTGDLGGAAKQLAITIRRQLAIRGKAATLMLYPAIVLSISLIVSIGMMTMVVPRIIGQLRDAVGSMPWFTELVYWVGTTMRDNAMFLGILLAGVVVAGILMRGEVTRIVGRMMRTLPYLREVVLAQEQTRFFTVMSAMSRSGVVLADALGVAEGAIGHPMLRAELARLRTRLIEGGVLRSLIDDVKTLPLPTRRLLIAAERSGDMQQAFDTLATDSAEEVDRRSSRLLAILEPALIVVMFLMIGSLVLSIMIPLITLTSRVQGV